jgi:dihydrofolate reductase
MREVILCMSMWLDGFVGCDREHPGVAIPEDAALNQQWKLEHISRAGAHLMGRVTYQEMSSYWPQSQDPYAAPMNDIPKIGFSSTTPQSRHLDLVEARPFPSGVVVQIYRPQHN